MPQFKKCVDMVTSVLQPQMYLDIHSIVVSQLSKSFDLAISMNYELLRCKFVEVFISGRVLVRVCKFIAKFASLPLETFNLVCFTTGLVLSAGTLP